MPYKDPDRQREYDRERYGKRKAYFREYARNRARSQGKRPSMGWETEEMGLSILEGARRIYRPCDLEWKGKLVDVKTAIKQRGHFIQWTTRESLKSSTYRWRFSLEKQFRKVDLYLVICRNEDKTVEHVFLIPDRDLKKPNLSISENRVSKYSQYRLA